MKYKVLSIKYKIIFLAAILYTAYCILYTPAANAQETSRTFTIVPPSIQKSLNPGDKAEGKLKVINDSAYPLTFNVTIHDYIVDNNNGIPNLLPSDTLSKKYSAASWIGVWPSTFTVNPREKEELSYFIQIPADAKPGGHYAAIAYQPTTTVSVKGTGAAVSTVTGTLFYIDISGKVSQTSIVSKFFADAFQEYGPVKIETQIKNFGDLHIKPVGKITVTDMLGRVIKAEDLEAINIFPGASRVYENNIGSKIMIGRFKASLLASYGRDNNMPLTSIVYFWVFPWRITLVIILIIVALILGWKVWKKRSTKIHADKKQINADSPSKPNA